MQNFKLNLMVDMLVLRVVDEQPRGGGGGINDVQPLAIKAGSGGGSRPVKQAEMMEESFDDY